MQLCIIICWIAIYPSSVGYQYIHALHYTLLQSNIALCLMSVSPYLVIKALPSFFHAINKSQADKSESIACKGVLSSLHSLSGCSFRSPRLAIIYAPDLWLAIIYAGTFALHRMKFTWSTFALITWSQAIFIPPRLQVAFNTAFHTGHHSGLGSLTKLQNCT